MKSSAGSKAFQPKMSIEICIQRSPVKIFQIIGNSITYLISKLAGILQGIIGRVRDGTAASKHAEDRADQVRPLAEAAWSLVEKNYK